MSDGSSTIYFIQAPTVYRYTIATGAVVAYANSGVIPAGFSAPETFNCTGTSCPFGFPPGETSGLTLDAQGNLYVGDDPGLAAGLLGARGRIWEIPAGSQPVG